MLAFLDLNPERFAQLVVNLLAVGGAFLAGQGITALAAWFLDRWLTGGKSPHGLKRAVRLIGGAVFAILAALILFGHGSGWTLMGGGPGDTNGSPNAPGTGKGGSDAPATTPSTEQRLPTPPQTVKHPAPTGERVRVTLLGGDDVKDERFYLVDDDPTAKTFAETRAAVLGRKEAATKPLGVEVRFSTKNTLPANHPAVLRLTNWATANGLPVTLPAGE